VSERAIRVVLALAGAYHFVIGALALVAPGTFFDQIGDYGIENSHYVGDNGSFAIALGIVLLLAVGRPSWRVPLLVLTAAWYGFHAVNHLFDVSEAQSDARGIFDIVALAAGAVFAAYLARLCARTGGVGSREPR
jgi:hypothetical protein